MGEASSRRKIFSWACFDFANSAFGTLVLTFVYNSLYTNVIAENAIAGTRNWGTTVAIASVVIAVLSPMLGAVADAYGWKKRLMTLSIAVACMSTALLYFPYKSAPILALVFFGVALVATELSIVFNNAFLPEIAPKEAHGKVSGQAFAFGYAGGLLCLVLAFVGFITDSPWFGIPTENHENVRATNVLVAIWFAVFSVPILVWVPERKASQHSEGLIDVARKSFARLVDTFHRLREYKELFWLLISRLFYNDGLVTVFSFGGIYAMSEFGFTQKDLLVFGIVLNLCSGVGAYVFSFVEDRIGSRTTILISLVGLVFSSGAAVFVTTKPAFWVCAIVIGLFIGPNQSASRAYLSRLTPKEKANEFFGFFAFSGKATAFLGPLLYGQLTGLFESQRAGMAVIPVLVVVGMVVLMAKTKPRVA